MKCVQPTCLDDKFIWTIHWTSASSLLTLDRLRSGWSKKFSLSFVIFHICRKCEIWYLMLRAYLATPEAFRLNPFVPSGVWVSLLTVYSIACPWNASKWTVSYFDRKPAIHKFLGVQYAGETSSLGSRWEIEYTVVYLVIGKTSWKHSWDGCKMRDPITFSEIPYEKHDLYYVHIKHPEGWKLVLHQR